MLDAEAGIDSILRALLKRAIIHCSRYSREQIADELTGRLHRKISPATLDAWTAETKKPWHLPADAVPVLCEILQDDGLQRQLLSPRLRDHLALGESISRSEVLLEKALTQFKQVKKAKR
jgi:hypothetical protein